MVLHSTGAGVRAAARCDIKNTVTTTKNRRGRICLRGGLRRAYSARWGNPYSCRRSTHLRVPRAKKEHQICAGRAVGCGCAPSSEMSWQARLTVLAVPLGWPRRSIGLRPLGRRGGARRVIGTARSGNGRHGAPTHGSWAAPNRARPRPTGN